MRTLIGHRNQMFSAEFLEHIVRHFNGVVKDQVLVVTINRLEIRFDRYLKSDRNVVVSLFSKLAEAFRIIKDRYLLSDDLYSKVRIELEDHEEYYVIEIIGAMYIPPGKILNLFSLILWYYIRYKTGEKPGQSDYGQRLTEEWKEEEDHLRHEINKSNRKLTTSSQAAPCYLCGEDAYIINKWKFKSHDSGSTINMKTRVCNKHRSKLI